ncbi:MAG: flagellar basal body rod protein FlgC [Planctomycetota bacterium]
MLSSLDISATGLEARRLWMNTIAENLANSETTRDAAGRPIPYSRRQPTFAPQRVGNAIGVKVTDIQPDPTPAREVYQPGHPDADPVTGVVRMPNVNVVQEMVDMLVATRSYEANVTAMEATKSMGGAALRILA